MDLAVSLSQAFKEEEVGMKAEHFSPIYNTSTVPFVFPIFDSYDMDLATKLSKRIGISPQRIFSFLIQIIYTLLQFHVKRLFRLDPSELFVPDPVEYSGKREKRILNTGFLYCLVQSCLVAVYQCA